MFLLYVDESGDVGRKGGSSAYFVLSGLVVHETRWRATLEALVAMRRTFRAAYGVRLRDEIHAVELVHHAGPLAWIPRYRRIFLLKTYALALATIPDISIINVLVDKAKLPPNVDVFDRAWRVLIQRFHNTISHKNFPGPNFPDDRGLIVTDATDGKKLTLLARKLRKYNPIPNQFHFGPGYRQVPLDSLVEDPVERDSRHSFFIQSCDVCAYLLTQKMKPNRIIRKQGAQNYFDVLGPILCKVASNTDPQGIVRV